ncbi:hypothetical protein FHT86_002150 [Rhizobium sp. BK313]|uniref:hypothetical protein n=1 Tax=Rhizobium sp. BK313 TaxID=2587081 RepID=UPI001617F3D6|nr:hypothetical protein [Rhizobium sp. BK313]MBB3453894.1 hypothetical protein [Rhizobium sp. BK313]
MKLKYILGAIAALCIATAAVAQTISVPLLASLGQSDLVQVIKGGAPSAQSTYATVGSIAGVDQYSYQIPLTGFAITVPNFTSLLYLNPAGTLATGTLTMSATPSDGQRFCVEDTQTQTAITVSANTGQTMLTSIGLGAVTALVANTRVCWYYNAPLAGWIRTQ